jgi:NAD(P)-dependent dehydrogenase (short-subunit alcohol dehydrogenase family)
MVNPKAILVTGASRGIGRAIALNLDKKGFLVLAGVRENKDAIALQESASERLIPLILDITSDESLQAAFLKVQEIVQHQGLYGLVNNAGILISAPIEMLNLEMLRQQLEVNVIAQVAVTQTFLPLLHMAKGRIINMSSISGILAVPFLGAYCASKFALEAISDSMRMELKPFGIHVASIEPSFVKTKIWQAALERKNLIRPNVQPDIINYYTQSMEKMGNTALQATSSASSPEKIARVVTKAFITNSPKSHYCVDRETTLAKISTFLPTPFKQWLLYRRFNLFEK